MTIIPLALLSDKGFETRIISLWVFLHLCVGHGSWAYKLRTIQWKRVVFKKKSEKFIIFSFILHK